MSSLYNLSAEYQALLAKDEYTDLDLMELDKLHANIEDRVVHYAGVIQELESKLAATKVAITNATDKKRRIEANIARLEEYVTAAMIANSLTCIDKSPLFDVKVRNNSPSVDDYQREVIPAEYWVTKYELQLDKNKIKDDIVNLGLVIPGVKLVRKVSLQIK